MRESRWPHGNAHHGAKSPTASRVTPLVRSNAHRSSPGMAATMVGAGATYPSTFWDANGEFLTRERTYTLHLPPNPPAMLFWAVTLSQHSPYGFLDRTEWGRSFNPGERMRPLPMLIDDTSSLSVLDIRTRTKRLQMERGLAMIVIDYLQLLTSNRRKDNRQQEVAEIRRDLKILAKEFNVPVLALSQLSRAVEGTAR